MQAGAGSLSRRPSADLRVIRRNSGAAERSVPIHPAGASRATRRNRLAAGFPAILLLVALGAAGCAMASPGGPYPPAGTAIRSEIHYIYVVPISHLDIGFNTSVPELRGWEKAYLDDAMSLAEQYPGYRFTVESIWQLDQWLEQTPDPGQVARLRGLIGQGRIEITAGYAGMHQGLLGAETFNRFLYAARRYETEWGLDLDTVISDDVPGSSTALPQVLRGGGIRNLIAGINTAYGGMPAIPPRDRLFNWQGVDGSTVLSWVSADSYAEGIFTYYLTAAYRDMKAHTQAVVDTFQQDGYPYDSILALLGFDNDGADTVVSAFANINRWNNEHIWPQIVVATPADFFGHVRAVYGDGGFTVYPGDWSGRWENLDMQTPVSMAQIRSAQDAAPQAETLATVLRAIGAALPPVAGDAARIYQDALIYLEHSGPGGGYGLTAAQITVNDQWFRDRALDAAGATGRIVARALTELGRQVNNPVPALLVYNGLGWTRSGRVAVDQPLPARLVDLATGADVAVQPDPDGPGFTFVALDVPACGYRLYRAEPGDPPPAGALRLERRRGQTVENEFYRVTVNESTGDIASIWDKRAGRELVDAAAAWGFNHLVVADQEEACVWGTAHDVPVGTVQVTVENGTVCRSIVILRDQSPLSRTAITLPAGLPRVDILNTFDAGRTRYAGHDVQSYWYFTVMPFVLGTPRFVGRFQGPAGWLAPQGDWIAGTRHNVRVSRHGTDIRGYDGFGVTLANREAYLGSFGSLGFWDGTAPEAPVLYTCLFTRTDEAETADQGWVPFTTWEPGAARVFPSGFSLTSGSGGFDAAAAERFCAGFCAPLLTTAAGRHLGGRLPGPSGSLLGTSHPGVVVSTLKQARFENPDGGDLILRLQEIAGGSAAGVTVSLPFPLAWAETAGITEQRAGAAALPVNPLRVSLNPWQTLTVRLRPAGK